MKTNRIFSFACLAIAVLSPKAVFADATVKLNVTVKNPPTASSLRIPFAGTYTFSVSAKHTRVACPDGTALIFDFDKKLVSTLDPDAKTFYQVSLDDFLTYGQRLPQPVASRYSVKLTETCVPTVGQQGRQILGVTASPFDLQLEAELSRQARSSSGGFGGRRRHSLGGGFPGGGYPSGGFPGGDSGGGDIAGGFPGDPSSSGATFSLGINVSGQLWLADYPTTTFDRSELLTAEACVLFRGDPSLKSLTDQIRRKNLTVLGADYFVSILDRSGVQPLKSPEVSLDTLSVDPDHFDPTIFLIPAEYQKVTPPTLPLGTFN